MTYETYAAKAARINAAIVAYQTAKAAADAAAAVAKAAKADLAQLIDKCPDRKFYGQTARVYYREYDRAGFDTKGLRRDLWDLVSPYATTTHVCQLCVE